MDDKLTVMNELASHLLKGDDSNQVSLTTIRPLLKWLTEEITEDYKTRAEEAEEKIEAVNTAMSETSPSWGYRIHAVLSALGLDYGDLQYIEKSIEDQANDEKVYKLLEEERIRQRESEERMLTKVRGRRYLWCSHMRNLSEIIHHFDISDAESENLLNMLGSIADMGLWYNDKANPTLRSFGFRLDKERKTKALSMEVPNQDKSFG